MRTPREVDAMAHELAVALDRGAPLRMFGIADLAEDDFLRVARQLHRIAQARAARMQAQVYERRAEDLAIAAGGIA